MDEKLNATSSDGSHPNRFPVTETDLGGMLVISINPLIASIHVDVLVHSLSLQSVVQYSLKRI